MSSKFKLLQLGCYIFKEQGVEVGYEKYPGGEIRLNEIPKGDWNYIFAELHSSDDIMALCLLKDALDRRYIKNIELELNYMPYARQDRAVYGLVGNEALSLAVMARIINSLEFSKVSVMDPHSDVARALIKNINIYEREDLMVNYMKYALDFGRVGTVADEWALLAPDAGAMKATAKIAQKFGINRVAYAEKVRDMATGKITGTKINNSEVLSGSHVIVADDICDGGGTFIGIGEALEKRALKSLNLYVTHGIFSQGFEKLFSHYDTIYSTAPFDENLTKFGYNGYNIENKYPLFLRK